ncbi:Ig-like domain-containing protein [Cohnella sp. OV330]|uniref:Ig-like domain-containing protein n=1 Tax=Cohnella sp. OV330 TaxID=1855288 RepID=UPI002101B9D9|nr:Ig-like domain-containing protein [Cohnella sp. OV330]
MTVKNEAGLFYQGVKVSPDWDFSTIDTWSPLVTKLEPSDGEVTELLPALRMTFDEPVRLGTGSWIVRRADTGDAVLTVPVANGIVTDGEYYVSLYDLLHADVYPWNPLDSGTSYYIDVAPGTLVDHQGNAYEGISGPSGWNFRTVNNVPSLRYRGVNQEGATPELRMRFSEAVELGTGFIEIHRQTDNSLAERIAVSGGAMVGGTYHFSGGNGIRVTLDQPLADDQSYYVQVTSGTFRDLTGHGFSGVHAGAWTFRTADLTAPTATYSPDDGAESGVWPYLQMTFDEQVRFGNGSLILRRADTGEAISTVLITSGTTYYGNEAMWLYNNQLEWSPQTRRLDSGTSYYVDIAPGTFRDNAGNAYAGVIGPSGWDFRTTDYAPTLRYRGVDQAGATPELAMRFSEAIELGTGFIEIHRQSDNSLAERIAVSGGAMVGGTYHFSGGNGIRVTLGQPLANDQSYYVQVTSGTFRDLTGQGFSGVRAGEWRFQTADLTAPTATYSPDDGAESGVWPYLQMTFDEQVRFGAGSLILRRADTSEAVYTVPVTSGTTYYGSYGMWLSNNQLVWYPQTQLDSGTSYYVDIAPGTFRDNAGNAYAGVSGPSGWDFRTTDYAPKLRYRGVDQAGATPELRMRFSEAIELGTGFIEIHRQTDNSLAERIAVSGGAMTGGTYQFSGGNGIRVTLDQPLADDQSYYVQVTSGTFRDLTGHGFSGIHAGAWTFRTADLTAPTAAYSPDDGAESGVWPYLQMTFDEQVRFGTGSLILRRANTGEAVYTVPVTSGTTYYGSYGMWLSNNQLVWYPQTQLDSGTSYYVDIAPGTFRDNAGNAYAGVSGPSGWDFRTTDYAPTLRYRGVDQAGATPELAMRFSEAIELGTGFIEIHRQSDNSLAERIAVSGGTMMGGTYQFSGGNGIRVTLDQPLADDQSYYVQVTSGTFRDLTGQGFSGVHAGAWTFRTADLTAPTATYSPDDGAESGVWPVLRMTFDEQVRFGNGSLILRRADTGEAISTVLITSGTTYYGNEAMWLYNNQLEWSPQTRRLDSGTSYYVDIAPGTFRDNAGNAYAGVSGPSGWDFRTKDSPPKLLHFETDTDTLAPTLRMQFNEAIELGTGYINIYRNYDGSLAEQIVVSDGGMAGAAYEYSGISSIRIKTQQQLAQDQAYYVQIVPGTFKDLKGHGFSGYMENYWTFRTKVFTGTESNPLPNSTDSTSPVLPTDESKPPVVNVSGPNQVLVVPTLSESGQVSFTISAAPDNAMVYYYHEKFKKWIAVPSVKNGEILTATVPEGAWAAVIASDEIIQPADTVKSWANADILKLISIGIVNGYEDGSYRPNVESNRYEVAVMIARALAPETTKADQTALDQMPDQESIPVWARASVVYMVSHGIMGGSGGGFDGSSSITRAQLATIIGRLLPDPSDMKSVLYKDGDAPEWAKEGIAKAAHYGIMNGFPDGTFGSDQPVTREQLAKVLSALIEIL